jgi:BirA family biotin operon repressor/biotin-[acetyl-CoA-carboxylase] ligase
MAARALMAARARRAPAEPLAQRVYRLLADRAFHSGTALAAATGVSRSAVWKALAGLRALGVPVHAVANRGYRLPLANDPLEAATIRAELPAPCRARLRHGTSVWVTGSTNADLLQSGAPPPGQFDFRVAEYQSAGRGRRARSWLAPPGGALCLSIGWSFASLPPGAGAVGLVIGVCALRALQALGLRDVALKWPNDLVVAGAKLGGILIELRAESGGPAYIVVGIGLNVALGAAASAAVAASGTEPADLAALGIAHCDRNALAGALIAAAVDGLLQFERAGFAPFAEDWRAADALRGKAVHVSTDAGPVSGHARGIDADGALRVQTRDGLQRFTSGDVSVRAVP